MNSNSLPLILSGLALVVAGATFATSRGDSSSRGGVDQAVDTPGAEVIQLREQVAKLTSRLADLESRETLVPAAATGGILPATNRVSASPSLDEETLSEVRSVAAALRNGDGTAADQLANLIVDVVERREQEELAAERAEQQQFFDERLQEQVAGLVENLGLDKYQEDQVWKLLDSQAERREKATEIFQSRDITRMEEARDELRAMRTEADETFKSFLTSSQYEQFDEMGGARRLGSPVGGGRGGGWTGGGGGGRGGRGN